MAAKDPAVVACSVIILTRNSGATLGPCLDSVLSQGMPGFEVIIVDHRSSDGTTAIVKRYAKKDPRVRLLAEKLPGLGAARNTGVKAAAGDVIVWTDSDCEAPAGWLDKMVRPIRTQGEDFVQGNEEALDSGFWSNHAQLAGQRHKAKHRRGKYIGHIDPKNLAMRKNAVLKAGGFDDRIQFLEDFDLFVRIKKAGFKVRYLPDVRIKHHHRTTFRAMAETRKLRGFWSAVVYQKYKADFDAEGKKDVTIKSNYAGTAFGSSLGLLKLLFSEGPSVFFYESVTSIYWRIGISKGKREWKAVLKE